MKRTILAVLLSTGLLAGCVSGVAVAVPGPPPRARVEVRGVAPSSAYVWVGGHWAWKHGNWVWVSGQWKRPPRGHSVWVAGHWTKRGRGWVWVDGHWK